MCLHIHNFYHPLDSAMFYTGAGIRFFPDLNKKGSSQVYVVKCYLSNN